MMVKWGWKILISVLYGFYFKKTKRTFGVSGRIIQTKKYSENIMIFKIANLAILFLLTSLLGASFSSSAQAASLEQQRALFLTAEKAIKRGDYSQLNHYREGLKNYPLLAYLDYAHLKKHLSNADNHEIEDFIALNSDTPLANRLRYLWLKKLARTNRDDTLIANFQPTSDTALDCTYRSALLDKGLTQQALDGIQEIWLSGQSQPDSCNPVFRAWKKTGAITDDLTWQRIDLAMQKRKVKLAGHLARALPAKQQEHFKLWRKVHKQPRLIDKPDLFSANNPIHTKIIAHGVIRLAFRDIDHAIESWELLQEDYHFSKDNLTKVSQTLALLIGQKHHTDALTYLSALSTEQENQRIREWRVRAAIRERDWPSTLSTIAWLTDEEQADPRWRYWRARALAELGFDEEAKSIYAQLQTERNYHGFLAADQLQIPYSFENQPATVSTMQLEIVASLPGIRRAKELFELGRLIEARREWSFASERLNEEQLLIAAKLAESWEWHSSAIFTAARISYWDDIPLRFPLGHQNAVIYQANKFDIEPAWVYGIMRQESAFVSDARSGKGALGLMQIMPNTGKYIAGRNKTSYSGKYDLLIADKNIKLGSAYLKDVRKRLSNNAVLATAAYNAGYTRVKRWLPDNNMAMEADIWIETIPYDETRDYLERVLSYTVIYAWRLNPMHANTLANYMKPIGNPSALSQANKTASIKGG